MIKEFRNKRMVASALETLHKGSTPTNEELAESVTILTPVVDLLEVLGERYHLMWQGLEEDLKKLRNFHNPPVLKLERNPAHLVSVEPKKKTSDLSLREINTQLKDGNGKRPSAYGHTPKRSKHAR